MLPFVSLSGATDVAPGAARDLEAVLGHHSCIVSVVGGTVRVAVEGSHDGTTWAQLNSANIGASPSIVHADRCARFVRASISEVISGSPTVQATVASA